MLEKGFTKVTPIKGGFEAWVAAGYPVEDGKRERIAVAPVASRRGDPAWDRLGVRVTRTDARDAKANR